MIGSGGASSRTFSTDVGTSAIGVYLTIANKVSNKKYDKLVMDYEAKYSEKPIHIGRSALRDTLYGTSDYEGITGRLSCDAFGDLFGGSYSIIRLNNLSAELKRFDPTVVYQFK